MGVRAPARCTPRFFLLLRETQSLLNGRNVIRRRLSEPFQVEVLDVLSQRHFPRFLLMIVQLAELDRVHTQLPSHLDLGVGEVMALSRAAPLLHLGVRLSFLRHSIRLASIYLITGEDRLPHPRPRGKSPLPRPTLHGPPRRCLHRRT